MRSETLSRGYVRSTADLVAQQSLPLAMVLAVSFICFLVLYIWSVNNTIASSIAIQSTEKQRIAAEAEIARLEGSILQSAVGGNLEDRAREQGLVIFGPPRFLTRDVVVAALSH